MSLPTTRTPTHFVMQARPIWNYLSLPLGHQLARLRECIAQSRKGRFTPNSAAPAIRRSHGRWFPSGRCFCAGRIRDLWCVCSAKPWSRPKLASEGRADSDAGSYIPEEFTAFFRQSNISRLSPSLASDAVFHVQAPVGRPDDASQVELGTAVTILLCFAYLVYTLYKTALRLGYTNHPKSS